MTSGNEVSIRHAVPADIEAIKLLADAHRHELGFLRRPALLEAINRHELLVAQVTQDGEGVVGFVEYRHRRDEQTTLHNVVVHTDWRRHGIGRQLAAELELQAKQRGKSLVLLKCPQDLPANAFYKRIGYRIIRVEPGKARKLNIWSKNLR